MKKISTVLIAAIATLFVLTGCAKSWEKNIQVSDLTIEEGQTICYINGQVKNLTDKYYDVKIYISAKSGSINEDITSYTKLHPYEIKDFTAVSAYDATYKYSIRDIALTELEIPELSDSGEITKEEVEYYFTDIYNQYTSIMWSVADDYGFDYANAPYISEIERQDGLISLSYFDDNAVAVSARWDENTQKLHAFSIMVPPNVHSTYDHALFIGNSAFDLDTSVYIQISKLINNPDEQVYSAGDWIYGTSVFEEGTMFTMVKQ